MVDVTEQVAALPDATQAATWLEQTVPCAGAHVAEAEAVEVEVKEQTLFVPLTEEQVARLLQTVPDMVLQALPTDAVVIPVGPVVTLDDDEEEDAVAEPEEDDEDPDDPTS